MKRYFFLLTLVLGISVLAACSPSSPATPPEPQEETQEEPKSISYDVTLFFANLAYVETGDEKLPHYLTEERSIVVPEGENVYVALIEALIAVDTEGKTTAVTTQMTVLDSYISLDDPTILVVDMAAEGLASGSLGESLFIGQVVKTLLSNETVVGSAQQVQFLVDGYVTESLMGHIEASEPFRVDFDL